MIRALLGLSVVLGLMLMAAGARILAIEKALSQKPKIEYREKIVEKKVTVRVAGPVRVEEKIVEGPGRERTIERVIYRDTVTTNAESDKEAGREAKVEAACPPARPSKRWQAAAEFGPRSGTLPVGGRVGMTLFDTLTLDAGYRKDGQDRFLGSIGIRF